jgi:hypothetical protein
VDVPHDHSHSLQRVAVPPAVQRLLLVAVAPFVAATAIGLIILWPGERNIEVPGAQFPVQRLDAVVKDVAPLECPDVPGQENFICTKATVEITEGSSAGDRFQLDFSRAPNAR